jgi:indolepyruvate ferredoxin oxidoreductase
MMTFGLRRCGFEVGAAADADAARLSMARRAAATGEIRKTELGAWMGFLLRGLAKLRFLRGTPLDPFRWSEERRTERELIEEYKAAIEQACAHLDAASYECALEMARLPEGVRGYGHMKRASLEKYRTRMGQLMVRLQTPIVATYTP